jgi:hypothetical protein
MRERLKMSDGNLDLAAEHRALAQAVDLTTFSPAQPDLFQNDVMWPYFERLRKESPVHFTPDSDHGPYWSVTRYNDIMAMNMGRGPSPPICSKMVMPPSEENT